MSPVVRAQLGNTMVAVVDYTRCEQWVSAVQLLPSTQPRSARSQHSSFSSAAPRRPLAGPLQAATSTCPLTRRDALYIEGWAVPRAVLVANYYCPRTSRHMLCVRQHTCAFAVPVSGVRLVRWGRDAQCAHLAGIATSHCRRQAAASLRLRPIKIVRPLLQ